MSWITAVHNAIAAVIAASSSSVVLSRRAQVRRQVGALCWRTELRLRPGPGFAFLFELVFRWGRLAALHRGVRSRLGLGHFAWVFRADECPLDLFRVAPILDTANLCVWQRGARWPSHGAGPFVRFVEKYEISALSRISQQSVPT
jgi:hypothetical protein